MKGYRFLLTYAVVVIALILVLLLSGCATKVVTVPEIHTEYVYRTDSFLQRDSIYVNDSVFVREKGDTVWIERYKTLYRDRWRDVVRVDSVVEVDSIPYKVEVEKSLTWWERQKIEFGELAMFLMAVWVVFVVLKYKLS